MNSLPTKTVIIICGPTATGKTALAIQLAKHFNTQIISADSRQCYKELNIGVARPSPQELLEVPHHFIASHSIKEDVTAATFEKYAVEKAGELFREQDVVIMVGGTGLYIKAFCEGLDPIPVVDPAIRAAIIANYEQNGLEWLQEEIRIKDPGFYSAGEMHNPQRLMRALEVKEATGESILLYQKGEKVQRDFSVIKIGLELPKEELQRNIANRVEQMVDSGLVEEARQLIPYKQLNALQTVGYAELFKHFKGELSLPVAIGQIVVHTRQYAKRQMTWFKKDTAVQWFHPGQLDQIHEIIGK